MQHFRFHPSCALCQMHIGHSPMMHYMAFKAELADKARVNQRKHAKNHMYSRVTANNHINAPLPLLYRIGE